MTRSDNLSCNSQKHPGSTKRTAQKPGWKGRQRQNHGEAVEQTLTPPQQLIIRKRG